MLLTLRQLQIFCSVAKTGTTTAAAEDINLSQSAISAATAELEKNLECPLFDRVGKKLQLNDHGRALLPMARSMLQSVKAIEDSFSLSAPSTVRIGASLTIGNYLLPRLLARFPGAHTGSFDLDLHPEIHISNTAEIIAKVAALELDFGLIEGSCHHPDVKVSPWWEDELAFVAASTGGFAAGRHRLDAKAFDEVRWLIRESGSGTREALEHALKAELLELKHIWIFNDHEAIKQAAIAGLGVACLSRLMVEDAISSGRLVEVKTPIKTINRTFSIISHRQKTVTKGMAMCFDFLHQERRLQP